MSCSRHDLSGLFRYPFLKPVLGIRIKLILIQDFADLYSIPFYIQKLTNTPKCREKFQNLKFNLLKNQNKHFNKSKKVHILTKVHDFPLFLY